MPGNMFRLRCCRPFPVAPEREELVPLRRVAFQAVIKDGAASVQITQTFRNLEKDPIECEYVFPVLEDSAMTCMTVQTDDGRILTAKIEDLEDAKESYTDAISEGNQAVLGRMETSDRMVLSIGNMAPHSKVVVRFTIVQPVKCEGKEWAFVIPAALLPLYDLGQALDAAGVHSDEDADDLTALRFVRPQSCSYKFQFSLRIFSKSPISNVTCPSHRVVIQCAGAQLEATVHTAEDSTIVPNKDFRVLYETVDAMTPSVKVQYDPQTQEYAAMLSFLPPLLDPGESADEATGPGEFILLIDRSGSMQGPRVDMAREALLLFIKSLPQQSRFNVVSFGTKFEHLFPTSVEYNAKTVNIALDKIAKFQADMNGTNIYAPMAAVLAKEPQANYPRTVFLLTDGAVSDPEAVANLVETHSKKTRVHTFGIGEGVSTALVNNVARAGNGIAEFIANPAEIKKKVINVLQKCLAPALTENELHWPVEAAKQFPSNARLSTCYFGEVFRVFAHFGQSPPPVGTSLLLTSVNSRTGANVSFEVPLTADFSEGREIHTLWARQAISELTNLYKASSDQMVKSEIVNISKKSGVPSLYTALLSIETRNDPVTGQMQLRKVPIATTRRSDVPILSSGGFHVLGASGGSRARGMMLCRSSAPVPSDGFKCATKSMNKMKKSRQSAAITREAEECKERASSALSSQRAVDPVLALVQRQQVDGHWDLQGSEAVLKGLSPPQELQAFGAQAGSVWATICIVLVLQLRYAEAEDEWKLVVGKAKRWLKAAGVSDLSQYADIVSSTFST